MMNKRSSVPTAPSILNEAIPRGDNVRCPTSNMFLLQHLTLDTQQIKKEIFESINEDNEKKDQYKLSLRRPYPELNLH
jgi:hypothetical protein